MIFPRWRRSLKIQDGAQTYWKRVYNESGHKSSYQKKKYFPKFSYPKKIPKPKILNPQKSFDPGHLKSGVPPGTQATKSSKIY